MKKELLKGIDIPRIDIAPVEIGEISEGFDSSRLPDPITPAEIGEFSVGFDSSRLPDPITPAEIGELKVI